jgi:glycosyltransferase involved in cell wall biosynthesis
MKFAILIPAYKPDQRLVHLVEALSNASQAPIVIINDGSPAAHDPVFAGLAAYPTVKLLAHPVNQGKGAALRTGFDYIQTLPAEIACVITADADGQHSLKDILGVAETAEQKPEAMIIGSRQFDKDVPPKSMFGNTVTRWVMRLFFGVRLWDTQTGLRGIPRNLLPELIEIPYDHYELEIVMLLIAQRRSVPMIEIPIETIYIEGNRGSHFKPLRDSARVYSVLLRYAFTPKASSEKENKSEL